MHLARLAQVEPERKPLTRRARSPTPSSIARAKPSSPTRDPHAGAAERSGPALDPRVEPLLQERHLRRRSSTPRGVAVVARRSERRKAASSRRPAATSSDADRQRRAGRSCARSTARPGEDLRAAAAAAARHDRVRLDPDRRLHAAHPRRPDRWRSADAVWPALVALAIAVFGAMAPRAGAAPADSRDPQRPDPARQGRVRREARPAAGRRVRRARHVLQHRQRAALGRSIAEGRSPTSSRRSSTSRTRSPSSARKATCCSRMPPMRARAAGHRSRPVARQADAAPTTPFAGWPKRRSSAASRAGPIPASFGGGGAASRASG